MEKLRNIQIKKKAIKNILDKENKAINMKKIWRSRIATLLGLITSICTGLAVIDVHDFDIKRDYFKVFMIVVPAITGYLSTINTKEPKDANNK